MSLRYVEASWSPIRRTVDIILNAFFTKTPILERSEQLINAMLSVFVTRVLRYNAGFSFVGLLPIFREQKRLAYLQRWI